MDYAEGEQRADDGGDCSYYACERRQRPLYTLQLAGATRVARFWLGHVGLQPLDGEDYCGGYAM